MANVDCPNGFRPVGSLTGQAPRVREYSIPSDASNDIFVGSIVKLASSASTDGAATIDIAGTSDVPVGVVTGFINYTNRSLKCYDASEIAYEVKALVCDDPAAIFIGQGDEDIVAEDCSYNAPWTAESGNTTTGRSTMEIDSSLIANTSTLGLQILGLVRSPDNAFGDYAKALVRFNVHQYNSVGTTGL